MLEVELIKKLVEAYTMWVTPPYYTNDAQDVIEQAVGLATDTEWEIKLQEILEPEFPSSTLEQLQEMFLSQNPNYTVENLNDLKHEANWKYHTFLQDADKAESKRVVGVMSYLIQTLSDSVSGKVHRRNLQIADLKRQLKTATSSKTISEHRALPGVEEL